MIRLPRRLRTALSIAAAVILLTVFFLLLPTPEPAVGAAETGAAEVAGTRSLVFRDVRLFDGVATVPRTTVVVSGSTIAAVGPEVAVPAGAEVIDGAGRTLLPGLIDAHTHTWGDGLARSPVFGVTTHLDMFTAADFAAARRAEQAAGEAGGRADLISAGTLVTVAGGHGTQFGVVIPTLDDGPEGAEAFVAARIEEGSDFIKVVFDDVGSFDHNRPFLSRATVAAVIAAAHRHGELAVVHISAREAARQMLEDGADGLVHLFFDQPIDDQLVALAVERGAFVIPTLTVLESASGTPSGAVLLDDPRLEPLLTPREKTGLGRGFEGMTPHPERLQIALEAARRLFDAGVPILAGTDAPNPGTAYGVSIHRELALLVDAGLPPAAALAAATEVPARVFGLDDRGRVTVGRRADLLLVEGDPTRDIAAARDLVGVWKAGRPIARPSGEAARPAASTAVPGAGLISGFDDGSTGARFGFGWMETADTIAGGSSTASIEVIEGGAEGTAGALRIRGEIRRGFPFPWAGAMFMPGPRPMAPVDFSSVTQVVLWARGDGGRYRLMVFAESLGRIPAEVTFTAGEAWTEHTFPLADFGADLRAITGLAVVGGRGEGPFRVEIDQMALR